MGPLLEIRVDGEAVITLLSKCLNVTASIVYFSVFYKNTGWWIVFISNQICEYTCVATCMCVSVWVIMTYNNLRYVLCCQTGRAFQEACCVVICFLSAHHLSVCLPRASSHVLPLVMLQFCPSVSITPPSTNMRYAKHAELLCSK